MWENIQWIFSGIGNFALKHLFKNKYGNEKYIITYNMGENNSCNINYGNGSIVQAGGNVVFHNIQNAKSESDNLLKIKKIEYHDVSKAVDWKELKINGQGTLSEEWLRAPAGMYSTVIVKAEVFCNSEKDENSLAQMMQLYDRYQYRITDHIGNQYIIGSEDYHPKVLLSRSSIGYIFELTYKSPNGITLQR
jgi:hypothetical protein